VAGPGYGVRGLGGGGVIGSELRCSPSAGGLSGGGAGFPAEAVAQRRQDAGYSREVDGDNDQHRQKKDDRKDELCWRHRWSTTAFRLSAHFAAFICTRYAPGQENYQEAYDTAGDCVHDAASECVHAVELPGFKLVKRKTGIGLATHTATAITAPPRLGHLRPDAVEALDVGEPRASD
jgi:hypothetical protein